MSLIVLHFLTALSKEGQNPLENSLEVPLEEAEPLGSCLGTWQTGWDWGMVISTGMVQGEESGAKVSHSPVSNLL